MEPIPKNVGEHLWTRPRFLNKSLSLIECFKTASTRVVLVASSLENRMSKYNFDVDALLINASR